jgi:hypothetical protein
MLSEDQFPQAYPEYLPTELESLQVAIEKRFTDPMLSRLLLFEGGWDWDVQIADGGFGDRVFALLGYLEHVGQLHWLIHLLDKKMKGYETFRSLRDKLTPPLPPRSNAAALAAMPAAIPTTPPAADAEAAWQMVLLDTDQPFLDRTEFRADCRLVGTAKTKRILSVTGGADTGKSYTARYLAGVGKFLPSDAEAFITKEIRLDRLNGVVEAGASANIDGLRLAQRLSLAITDEELPSSIAGVVGSEQETTWAADAVVSIMSKAKETPTRWIVFDGFEATVLSPCAQDLINSLIAQVATEQKVRIALLGYPGDVSWCESLHRVVLDKTEFTDAKKLSDHVFNYLLEVRTAAERRNRPPFTDQQLLTDVRDVLGGIDLSSPDLHALETALTGIAQRVLIGV